jgi:rhodanese-related sulfurtransferase
MESLANRFRILRDNYAPLAAIPEDQLLRLMRCYELDRGDRITFNSEQEECLFVLAGQVERTVDGETSLLDPRNTLSRPVCQAGSHATFTATQTSIIGRINPSRLDFLLSWESLRAGRGAESPFQKWLEGLRNPLIFSQLPLENAREVFRRLQPAEAKAGDVMFDMFEDATKFYFIEQGQVELWRPDLYGDELQMTKVLSAGDYFGEEALVTGGQRNAMVKVIEDSRFLVLEKDDFRELINTPMVDRVSSRVAQAMLDEGASLLDVRYEEEYEMEYIPGATLIPLLELRERVGELGPDERYVIYCHSGRRSDVAAMILRQHKLQGVSLIGGIRDWPYARHEPD